MNDETEAIQAANIEHYLERGPAISYAYQLFVVARCPASGEILLGGLGGMGVGQMWFTECDAHRDYPGYADAEIVAEAVGFGSKDEYEHR